MLSPHINLLLTVVGLLSRIKMNKINLGKHIPIVGIIWIRDTSFIGDFVYTFVRDSIRDSIWKSVKKPVGSFVIYAAYNLVKNKRDGDRLMDF